MEEITIEAHPRTAEELEEEAKERGYRTRSEYVRQLVLHRSVITSGPPVADQALNERSKPEETAAEAEPAFDTNGELEEIRATFDARLNELKQRVIALESELENQAAQREDES